MTVSQLHSSGSTPPYQNGEYESSVRPIAVVGMACRFPQEAENPEKLWEMLLHARSASTEFPSNKFKIDSHYHPDQTRSGSMNLRNAHFLKDSGHTFDAPFFNISKTETMTMDPQQRLLMENVYEALENAGISVEEATGSNSSVFVGAFTNDFHTILHVDPDLPAKYAPTGNSNSILSNRVSWFYDFKGCSLTLDTACSSSLVATHLACQNLREGSSEMSIVGGVNVIEYPSTFYDMSNLGFLSADGRCYSFDHRANGYSRGEGTGVVILKPLDAAIRDGNTIRAVIRNTGVNQDGRTPGMTIPSKAAQESLIRSVYATAGLDLASTTYVETHGTGTAQGDPKEAGAIAAAWAERTAQGKDPLYLGAIKSNIGHLEGASGVAGIIKTVTVLEKGIIPPNINFEKVNPSIPADKWGIQFPVKPVPFPDVEVRRASINSFGFGGTNAHVVLDDAYNYLRIHGLKALHRTVADPPKTIKLWLPESRDLESTEDDEAVTVGIDVPVNGEHLVASTSNSNGTERPKNAVNGTSTHENEVNGTDESINGINGSSVHTNDLNGTENHVNGRNGTNGHINDHNGNAFHATDVNGSGQHENPNDSLVHINSTDKTNTLINGKDTFMVNLNGPATHDNSQLKAHFQFEDTEITATAEKNAEEPVTDIKPPEGVDVPTSEPAREASLKAGANGGEMNGQGLLDASAGGISDHVVLDVPKIFVLSSFDENGAKRTAEMYANHLTSGQIPDEASYLEDLAYTLAAKRTVFSWKAFAIASSASELAQRLPKLSSTLTHSRRNDKAKAGFIFTGQGAQWHAMGRDLLVYPVFKRSMEGANAYLKQLGSESDLLDELSKNPEESSIHKPSVSQAACTALQIALVDLLASWGVQPARVVGHSSGEIAAAYCAGALTQESAWKIAYYRGIVSEKLLDKQGAMIAVGASQEILEPYMQQVNNEVEGELSIACFNSPKNITVSGDEKKVDRLGELLKSDDVFNRKLNVRNAYHSGHMQVVAKEYETLIGNIDTPPQAPVSSGRDKISFFSTVYGRDVATTDVCIPHYWVSNMVSPVLFTDTLLAMCTSSTDEKPKLRVNRGTEAPVRFLLEIGPHPALQTAIKETFVSDKTLAALPYTYLVQRNKSAVEQALQAVGKLYCGGYPIDITLVNGSNCGTGNAVTHSPNMLTDLPSYSFNHSQEYWPESRLCRNFRFRKHARLDLLGAPVMDWIPSEPKWRQFVRVAENPWLKDHKVTGRIVYPGVGYIVMALEAAKQLGEDRGERIARFVLRNISIKAALQVPESEEGIEVLLSMSPAPESSFVDSSVWKSFKISSLNPNTETWTEHCRGFIKTELETGHAPIDNGREASAEADSDLAKVKDCLSRCNMPVDMSRSYAELETIGLSFGPLFKNLGDVTHSPSSAEAIGLVTVPDVAASMPKKFLFPHIIHPTTMDSMIHVFLAAVQGLSGGKKVSEPMVPVSIKEVCVSGDLESIPGSTFRSYAIAAKTSHRRFEGSIQCWDPETNLSKVQFQAVQFVPLQAATSNVGKRQINFNIQWTPDMDLMSKSQCSKYLDELCKHANLDTGSFSDKLIIGYNLSAIIYILEGLESLKDLDEESLPSHLQKYLVWMRYQQDQFQEGKLLHQVPQWNTILANKSLKEKVLDEIENSGSEGRMAARIGTNIPGIMRKEVDALQLMFGDGLMDNYYREIHGTKNIHQYFRLYLDSYSLQYGNLKVLEIGAGTGGTTRPVLEALAPSTSFARVAKYTYTDISPGFFEKAKAKFKMWSHILEFLKLDIEKDPLEQGYEAGSYDIIIAANVLHATKDLALTLGHVKSLMKPGGKLLLQEAVQPRLLGGPLVFGTLPGWWLSKEEFRTLCPLLSESKWDEVLKSSGFSGTDQVLCDYADPGIHAQSLMIITNPVEPAVSETAKMTTAIVAPSSIRALSTDLAKVLQKYGITAQQFESWHEVESLDLKQTVCVVLHEVATPLLTNIDEENFNSVRTVLSNCGGLLWVTKDHMDELETSLSTGLVRSIRWERDMDDSNLVLLQLGQSDATGENATAQIARIFEQQFVQEKGPMSSEYKVEDGVVLTNRLINADYLDEFILSRSGKIPAAPRAFGFEPRRALKLTAETPGLLNTLQFNDCPVYKTMLGPHDVEVEIKATGINFRDIMASMGEVRGDTLGAEGSGIVTRVGEAVKNTGPGDRVALLASLTGCFQTFARTVDIAVAKIPDSVTYEQAACIPVIGVTVLYCLKDLARLRKGESVLIHAAAGGVGQAAIMYAQHVGAEIYATVSNDEKKEVLTKTYNIPVDHIFSSRDASFAKGIMRQTGGRGVDVILNSLAGEFLRLSWQCIAHFGRFIEIGKRDIYSNSTLEMFPFSRNVTFASADLETVMARDQESTSRLLTETVELWQKGVFRETTPLNVAPYSKIEESFRLVQAGKHIGKLVLTAGKDDIVPMVPTAPPEYSFASDATYVLSGGLGGLGRSTARWMVSRGARHLVFLSRSGASTDPIKDFIKELEKGGANIKVFACDVSDSEVLRKALTVVKESMPPIKGCIQGAMQLKDSAFENMRYDYMRAAILPKVNGSWNLHEQLPKDMDFFIMLSSICGVIGNRGQSNYAAGNTYQDALAHWRVKNNLCASTIDLGSMLSVGFIAENQETVNPFALAIETIREDEYHAILEHYIDPRNVRDQVGDKCQVAIGLASKASFAAKGVPMPSFMRSPLFTLLQTTTDAGGADEEEENFVAMRASLRAAKSLDEATLIILDTLSRKISSVMALPLEDIDPSKPVHFYGVDSLVAVELRNWLGKNMESQIEILDIMGDDGMTKLCEKVAQNSKLVNLGSEK